MKLGCLPYLNVKPLVYMFEHEGLPKNWELVYAPPSRLAEMLKQNQIDSAPVSVFASFLNPTLKYLPNIGIASNGSVKSVLLFSKKEIKDISTVALDTSSLSGAAMLKIILSERYNIEPSYISSKPDLVSETLKSVDAALIIGNPAMFFNADGYNILDLGLEWKEHTGLPAVFAIWAYNKENEELIYNLRIAKEDGMMHLDDIAKEESVKLGLDYEYCLNYLKNVIVYDFSSEHIKSIETFKNKSFAHGLL